MSKPEWFGPMRGVLENAVEALPLPIYYPYILILIKPNYQFEKKNIKKVLNKNSYVEMGPAKSERAVSLFELISNL
jgi:hypothetical protein